MSAPSVTVVDYGVGNLLSIQRAIQHVGGRAFLASTPEDVMRADRLVLPGVGAFRHCSDNLNRSGLAEAVRNFAATGRPFLGICVGMQLLFERSSEFGDTPGLRLISGSVEAIPTADPGGTRKVPHIGWARLEHSRHGGDWAATPLATLTPNDDWAYFVHSFSGRPIDHSEVLAEVDYQGFPICAAVRRENIVGLQFHPEKSGEVGLRVWRSFVWQGLKESRAVAGGML